MTEEEARKKWCFKFQVATSGGNGGTFETDNRTFEHETRDDGKWYPSGRLHPSCRCIASDCMAWRGSQSKYLDRGVLYDRDMTGTGKWVEVGGYCGLAGKP